MHPALAALLALNDIVDPEARKAAIETWWGRWTATAYANCEVDPVAVRLSPEPQKVLMENDLAGLRALGMAITDPKAGMVMRQEQPALVKKDDNGLEFAVLRHSLLVTLVRPQPESVVLTPIQGGLA